MIEQVDIQTPNKQQTLLTQLKAWKNLGLLRAIDYHFGEFIAQLGADNLTVLSATLCSECLGQGHICLPLETICQQLNEKCLSSEIDFQLFYDHYALSCLLQNTQEIHAQLSDSHCVSVQGSDDKAPLSLQYGALYLRRYAQFEQLIADKLLHQPQIMINGDVKTELDKLFATNYGYIFNAWQSDKKQDLGLLCEKYLDVITPNNLDWAAIENCFNQASKAEDLTQLEQLIPQHSRCDWQKVSAALALSSARCVISGGPGTGKTTTVTKLLALLLQVREDLNIKMVAPTGKAAARLTESITNALNDLHVAQSIKDKIPTQASTIHRLLGVKTNSNHFRHDENKRLHLDLLLVDEASMVDLPLMAKLLMALPEHARLILLGDKDQLASVEAGAVLGDICAFIDSGYSAQKAQQLVEMTGFDSLSRQTHSPSSMADKLCLLRKSYRFDQYSGIGYLASAINQGKANRKQVLALCEQYEDLHHYANNETSQPLLDKMIVDGYATYLKNLQPIGADNRVLAKQLLKQFNEFKILCAIREGEWGIMGLNQRAETVLSDAGLIKVDSSSDQFVHSWYVGRPVMITQNNYHLGLYNGDIGLCLLDDSGQLRVYFQMADGDVYDFQPSRLPSHETVYAMTVHKSQGSEFNHTVLALPQTAVPVVTRELIYTGITRAKKQLTLFSDLSLMARAIKNKTQRHSRLVERLKVE
ncbi:exodeoxyribonuclease V subunit alpha [Psychromonas sp. psych-6C06]|uniref:exodeoxyribonuclease V subunit alpha n=1 Tax=Psychromonas sp. psych-6C06 TaxID=2058089 RepID=UPI000C343946|nr:exodeoxyribonuclease V subunit alpha [Psychromonas sp. psych-6C06]PKF63587.1 exodeoxyribonuclease V subunit alpha [Psychromonas sp. psych-6C06]